MKSFSIEVGDEGERGKFQHLVPRDIPARDATEQDVASRA